MQLYIIYILLYYYIYIYLLLICSTLFCGLSIDDKILDVWRHHVFTLTINLFRITISSLIINSHGRVAPPCVYLYSIV